MNNHNGMCWLAAEYIFPSTYSIRVPGSSMSNAKALPAPGPGTIRLAMIRVGIELLGMSRIEQQLFRTICSAPLRICPPERISISTQALRVYKATLTNSKNTHFQEGLAIREYAHAEGNMTIFIQIPIDLLKLFEVLFMNIGYWGQANSLATCVSVSCKEPDPELSGQVIGQMDFNEGAYYMCFVTEFRYPELKWLEFLSSSSQDERNSILETLLYVWPLEFYDLHKGNTSLLRRSPIVSSF